MKTHLIKNRLKPHSPEWHEHRRNYINGSEVGGILGLSQYANQEPAMIFAQKVGYIEPYNKSNKHTIVGQLIEDVIIRLWQYVDDTDQYSYVTNFDAGKIQRKYKKYAYSLVNPKYPWLSITPDFMMNKGFPKLNSGDITDTEIPLEIKHVDYYEMQKWESGISPSHLAQVHAQMIVLETDYSELIMFDSRKNLTVYPVKLNQKFADRLIEETRDFHQRVLTARDIYDSIKGSSDPEKTEKGKALIDELEPVPTNSPGYEEFLKEKFKSTYTKNEKQGEKEELDLALKYVDAGEELKEFEEAKQGLKNNLLKALGTYERIDFGASGYVSYATNKNGQKALRVNVKRKQQ